MDVSLRAFDARNSPPRRRDGENASLVIAEL
jgi:hypothetical protein